MTRVLVVHHDIDIADQEVDSLRRRGYDLRECTGPPRNGCPVLAGRRCELAETADVLVYDVFATGAGADAQDLIENLLAHARLAAGEMYDMEGKREVAGEGGEAVVKESNDPVIWKRAREKIENTYKGK